MTHMYWLLASVPTSAAFPGNVTLGDDTQRFSFVVGGVGSDGRFVPRCRLWRNIPRRHLLLASSAHSGSWLGVSLRGGMFPWRECSDTDGAHRFDNSDAKCVDVGALGGRATRTANKTLGGVGYSRDGGTGSLRGGTGSWLLVPMVLMSRFNGTLGNDTQRFSFLGGGIGYDVQVVPRRGLWWNIPWRHWLLDSGAHSGSWLGGSSRDGMVPWRKCADTDGAHTVDDEDVKCVDAGALGGRATHTADKTPWGVGYSQDRGTGSWHGGAGSCLLAPRVLMSRVDSTLGDDTQSFSFVGVWKAWV